MSVAALAAADDEARRVALLHSLALLDSPPEPSFDGIAELAAHLSGSPVALVSLVDRDRVWVKAAVGRVVRELPRIASICTHVVGRDSLFEIEDTQQDVRLSDVDLVQRHGIRFYAGMPLRLDGHTLGTLCVMDLQPRRLDDAQRAALARLAGATNELLRSRQRLHAVEAERARLMDFAHASGDWMWETDAQLRYTWISGAFEPVTGLAPQALIDSPIANAPVLDAHGVPLPTRETLHDVMGRGRRFARLMTEKHTPRGRLIVSRSAVPVHDAAGRLVGWRGTTRDVTGQLRDQQLQRDKVAAERANRAKSEFLSRVSHELRTPLNSILGFMQLIAMDREHALAPDQRKRLEGAQRSGQRLLDLINDVLDLTRIEREDFSLTPVPVDLGRVVATCLAMIEPMARERGVTLPPAPPRGQGVLADRRALEQVLMNLLSNAIKYNRRDGAVRLDVEFDGPRCRLSVVDQGPGLSSHQLQQMFQPFNRLGAERTRIEGTGLGLVIARELVRAMHGTLAVDSRIGEGCAFTLELERADAADAETAPTSLDGPVTLPAPHEGPQHVLYIEDEPLNVLLVQELFRSRPGWTLHVAGGGREGVALARALQPDLTLVDMNLPDVSGIDVIGALRADPATASLRCIALSADAMREQIDAALAAGFDDYWTKPIDLRRMLEALAQTLGQ